MKSGWYLVVVVCSTVLAIACTGSPTTSPSGDSGSGSAAAAPSIAGVYNYESDATSMSCSDGTTVPLPMVTDTLTITQTGNRFDGELAIASTLPTPAGASFFEDCIINNDSTYSCVGQFSDANSVIVFNSEGRFTSTGFSGSTNLQMTLTEGTVCTWMKQERGTKLS